MIAHYILFFIQLIIIFICFIYSLKLIKNKISPSYMKFFSLYPIIAALIATIILIEMLFPKPSIVVVNGVTNISKIFHYFILSTLIYRIQNPKFLKYGQIAFILFGWVYLLYILFTGGWFEVNFKSQFIVNLFLVILSLLYFRSLLNNVSVRDLKKDPGFWIVVGTLFSTGVSLPLYASFEQLSMVLDEHNLSLFLDLTFIFFSIMYLAFIKAIRCTQIIQAG